MCVCGLSVYGANTEQLEKKVRELYDVMCRLEDEKYDWEMKLIRQNAEVGYAPVTQCLTSATHRCKLTVRLILVGVMTIPPFSLSFPPSKVPQLHEFHRLSHVSRTETSLRSS